MWGAEKRYEEIKMRDVPAAQNVCTVLYCTVRVFPLFVITPPKAPLSAHFMHLLNTV